MKPRKLLAALVLAMGLLPSPVAFAQGLTMDNPQSGTLTQDGLRVALQVEAGSYVEGVLTTKDQPLTLTMTDAAGAPLRLLLDQAEGEQVFRLIAPAEAMLHVSGPAGAGYALALQKVVTPPRMVTPPPDYLSPRLAALDASLAAGQDTAGFWAEIASAGTPLIEETPDGWVMTFLYRGAVRNVRLFGGPSSDHDWLHRLGDSDVWFKSYQVPAETRLAYRLAPDVPDFIGSARDRRVAILATAAADPLNRAPWPEDAPDAYNRWSTVALPKAPPQPGLPVSDLAKPDLQALRITSTLLGNSREVVLQRSPGYDPDAPDALLLVLFDGPRAMDEMDVPRMLDTLVGQGRLPPLAVAYVDPIDNDTRGQELPGNPLFADFLAQELMLRIAAELHLHPDPARIIVAGASYGGIGSTHAAMLHPEVFGNVISMSGSYWWAPPDAPATPLPYMAERLLEHPGLPVRFFITAGTFEVSRAGEADIRETSRIVYGVLRAAGIDATWREYAAGHDSFVWRGALMDGLIALFQQ